MLLLVWTNNSHHLIWKTVNLDTSGLVTVFKATYGPGFYANIAYTYILLCASTILLVRQAVRSSGNHRKQMLVILPGALAPWIGNLAYVILGLPIDLTPFGFLITGLVVIWSLYNYQLLEVSPSVRQLVFDSMPNSVVIIGGDGTILDANPATEKMFGINKSEILGKSPAHLWCWEEGAETLNQLISQELDSKGRWTREIRYVRQDGKTGVAEVVVKPLLDQNGWRIASIGVCHDITERVGSERILRFEPTPEDN
jgi:PAS domain S-box-containing protein